jgi:hypothetical protein
MLVIGQVAVAVSRCLILCIAIATAFALPTAVAAYHVVFALSQIDVPSLAWREVYACLGAVCIGGTAWARLAVLAGTRRLTRLAWVEDTSRPILSAAARQGCASASSSSNRIA